MNVAIISSCYGDYDHLVSPVPQSSGRCEWIMVTDNPTSVPAGWTTIVEPRPHMHPRLAAKVAKCRPDMYTDADVTIWVDASIAVRLDFVAWVLDGLGDAPLAQIPHPERTRIVDEADVSSHMVKYQGQPVIEQAAHYIKNGFPDGIGIWATGIIAYQRASYFPQTFGNHWLAEQMRWSYQDQISQPVLLEYYNISPRNLAGGLWSNPHFTVRAHRSDQ